MVLFSLYVFIINVMAAVNGTDSHVHGGGLGSTIGSASD